jgi:DNA-binding response OmpR family regulator
VTRILLIDDDEAVLAMMGTLLADHSYEVENAGDGNQGFRLFAANPPDLVITDIFMPNKEGFETIREMRRPRPDARIIAMSGGGRIRKTELLRMAMSLGADYGLAKPFDAEQLVGVIKSALGDR